MRTVTVYSVETLTPHMRRIVFTGDSLHNFPTDYHGGYVKLTFPVDGSDPEQSVRRSYSIRDFDPDSRQLTIDFVMHEPAGPACAWAQKAQINQQIQMAGPGTVKGLPADADWVLLVADMAGLPALAAKLERLPAQSVGAAVIEIPDLDDRQPLTKPDGIEVIWVVRDASGLNAASTLVDRVTSLDWRPGRPGVWSATEFSAMKQLRAYFKTRAVPPEDLYISSYWKRGGTDEEHRASKRAERAAAAAR